jgi:hypothetical protein
MYGMTIPHCMVASQALCLNGGNGSTLVLIGFSYMAISQDA